jgi:hypothetical protein
MGEPAFTAHQSNQKQTIGKKSSEGELNIKPSQPSVNPSAARPSFLNKDPPRSVSSSRKGWRCRGLKQKGPKEVFKPPGGFHIGTFWNPPFISLSKR